MARLGTIVAWLVPCLAVVGSIVMGSIAGVKSSEESKERAACQARSGWFCGGFGPADSFWYQAAAIILFVGALIGFAAIGVYSAGVAAGRSEGASQSNPQPSNAAAKSHGEDGGR